MATTEEGEVDGEEFSSLKVTIRVFTIRFGTYQRLYGGGVGGGRGHDI